MNRKTEGLRSRAEALRETASLLERIAKDISVPLVEKEAALDRVLDVVADHVNDCIENSDGLTDYGSDFIYGVIDAIFGEGTAERIDDSLGD